MLDAINSHDAKKIVEFYSEDAVVYDPIYPEPLRGRESIEKDAEEPSMLSRIFSL